jgi:hypothetical protein
MYVAVQQAVAKPRCNEPTPTSLTSEPVELICRRDEVEMNR